MATGRAGFFLVGQLKLLNELFQALDSRDPANGRTYWTAAKRRGERIAKLARLRGKLRLWRKWFNEPSHYSAPGQRQKIGEKQIREFVKELGTTLDALDFGLVVAAHNEIMSGGSIRAALDTGPENKPAIHQTHVVRIKDITRDREGHLAVTMARGPLEIVPNDIEKIRAS